MILDAAHTIESSREHLKTAARAPSLEQMNQNLLAWGLGTEFFK